MDDESGAAAAAASDAEALASGSSWRGLADGDPNGRALVALEAVAPAALAPAAVVDAIVVAERLISHVQGIQAELLADLARPGRAGDVTRLVQVLVDKGGVGRDPATGEVDPELVQAEIVRHAESLAAAEVAAALCVPHRTASSRIERAVEMVDELPVTLDALRAGRIDGPRARLIADGTRILPAEVRAAVEAAIVPLARTRVSCRVRELLERAVIAADPEGALALETQARAERTVTHRPGRHGIGHVNATLPAEGAVTVFTLLDLLAQATERHNDDRGIDARRADALVDICTELLSRGRLDLTDATVPDDEVPDDELPGDGLPGDAPAPEGCRGGGPKADDRDGGDLDGSDLDTGDRDGGNPDDASPAPPDSGSSARPWRGLSRHGRRPHLSVTVGLSTLAGLDRLPGHLAGHGAVTAELATRIARAAGTLNLIGVHPESGTAAAVSQTIYRPGQQVTDQIAAAAGTCRFPSCNQPAWRCDTDHRTSFNHADPESGGLTRLWDCDPECRRHHLLKTHAQWRVETAGADDPCVDWTSPTGHRYTDRPREFTIPAEEIDPWLVEIFTPARQLPPPQPDPPPDGPGREERDLERVDAIRRRIERLRWEQSRQRTLSRLAVLMKPSHGLPGSTPTATPVGSAPIAVAAPPAVATSVQFADAASAPTTGTWRPRASDRDHRARRYLERIAREAAGIPDDPPPF